MSTANATARQYKFRKGQRCRITGGPFAGKAGTIVFDEPVRDQDHKPPEWVVAIGTAEGNTDIVAERHIEPDGPAAHRWAIGDRVRIIGGSFVGWTGRIHYTPMPGLYYVTCDNGEKIAACPEYLEPIAKDEPAPAPPPPALYRVEYDVTDQAPPAVNERGDWVESLVTSRRAALVPIPDPAARARLAGLLEVLHDFEEGGDAFVLAHMGGVPVDPHAPGDRVKVGPSADPALAGRTFHLIERDEADGMRWWLAGEPGGAGWLGLHVDRFERDGVADFAA